jgi:hypothetical protein
MLISTPLAPLHRDSSSSGLAMALLAAFERAVSPVAFARAHHRLAHLAITVRTSAKSRLIRPGRTIRSVTPRRPSRALVGHAEGFGEGRAFVGDAEQVLVRDDDQRVDMLAQFLMPASASCMRRWPSKWNGLVTTPTVRMPRFRACAR